MFEQPPALVRGSSSGILQLSVPALVYTPVERTGIISNERPDATAASASVGAASVMFGAVVPAGGLAVFGPL